jgi:hypothetical protein
MATLLVQALEVWDFEIFIAGETPKAKLAYANLRSICDQYLANNCKITMQDISKNPKTRQRESNNSYPHNNTQKSPAEKNINR